MILILRKKIHFRENWLIFLGIWGEAELFLGIWGAKANKFREKRKLFSGSWGDQCIIFRDLGSTYPPPPPLGGLMSVHCSLVFTCWERANGMALLYVMFFLCFCHFPMWCPGSGVVFDCIDSRSLPYSLHGLDNTRN